MAVLFEVDALISYLESNLPVDYGVELFYGLPKYKISTSNDSIICTISTIWDPLRTSGVNKEARVECRFVGGKNVIPAQMLDLIATLITTLVGDSEDGNAKIMWTMKINKILEWSTWVIWPLYDPQERIVLIADFIFNYQYR